MVVARFLIGVVKIIYMQLLPLGRASEKGLSLFIAFGATSAKTGDGTVSS